MSLLYDRRNIIPRGINHYKRRSSPDNQIKRLCESIAQSKTPYRAPPRWENDMASAFWINELIWPWKSLTFSRIIINIERYGDDTIDIPSLNLYAVTFHTLWKWRISLRRESIAFRQRRWITIPPSGIGEISGARHQQSVANGRYAQAATIGVALLHGAAHFAGRAGLMNHHAPRGLAPFSDTWSPSSLASPYLVDDISLVSIGDDGRACFDAYLSCSPALSRRGVHVYMNTIFSMRLHASAMWAADFFLIYCRAAHRWRQQMPVSEDCRRASPISAPLIIVLANRVARYAFRSDRWCRSYRDMMGVLITV